MFTDAGVRIRRNRNPIPYSTASLSLSVLNPTIQSVVVGRESKVEGDANVNVVSLARHHSVFIHPVTVALTGIFIP